MKKLLLFICSLFLVFSLQSQSKHVGLLKHVVVMTFKPGADPKVIQQIDASFKNLSKLPMVKGYEWGVVSGASNAKQVQHVYITFFKDTKALDAYGKSPEHLAHIKLGADQVAGVQAVDYVVE